MIAHPMIVLLDARRITEIGEIGFMRGVENEMTLLSKIDKITERLPATLAEGTKGNSAD